MITTREREGLRTFLSKFNRRRIRVKITVNGYPGEFGYEGHVYATVSSLALSRFLRASATDLQTFEPVGRDASIR